MDKIIELAQLLGEEIAKSDEIRSLELAKEKFEGDAALQEKMSRYEADRKLLADEFSKGSEQIDRELVDKLRGDIDSLTKEITASENYMAFSEAQRAMNALMARVNGEIKFAITGERPAECTHDCSTCGGCH